MVAVTGFPYSPGGEPPESVVAPIREQLPIASSAEAAVLANRDLFGAVATDVMLPSMRATVGSWQPDLILRDPCEYASAIVAQEANIVVAQVAIGLAEVEWSSIEIAAPALEERQGGLVTALRKSSYCTRLPASLDASLFAKTWRYDDAPRPVPSPLPDWWNGSQLPLVYMTFGTVLGHMTIANEVYGAALEAVGGLEARGASHSRASLRSSVAPPCSRQRACGVMGRSRHRVRRSRRGRVPRRLRYDIRRAASLGSRSSSSHSSQTRTSTVSKSPNRGRASSSICNGARHGAHHSGRRCQHGCGSGSSDPLRSEVSAAREGNRPRNVPRSRHQRSTEHAPRHGAMTAALVHRTEQNVLMSTRLDDVRHDRAGRSRVGLAIGALIVFWATAWVLVVVRLLGSTGDWDNPTTDPPQRLSDGLFVVAAVLAVASGPLAYWIGHRRWLLAAPFVLLLAGGIGVAIADAT